jgi:hypothetical protein
MSDHLSTSANDTAEDHAMRAWCRRDAHSIRDARIRSHDRQPILEPATAWYSDTVIPTRCVAFREHKP